MFPLNSKHVNQNSRFGRLSFYEISTMTGRCALSLSIFSFSFRRHLGKEKDHRVNNNNTYEHTSHAPSQSLLMMCSRYVSEISTQMNIKTRSRFTLYNCLTVIPVTGRLPGSTVRAQQHPQHCFFITFFVVYLWKLMVLLHLVPQKPQIISFKTHHVTWVPKISTLYGIFLSLLNGNEK